MPLTYIFKNSMSQSATLNFSYYNNIVPIGDASISTTIAPGATLSYVVSDIHQGSEWWARATCINGTFLFPNGLNPNNSVQMGYCAFCNQVNTYTIKAHTASPIPAPVAGWTGIAAANLDIIDRLTSPIYGPYIVLGTTLLKEDINIALKNIRVEVYKTGGTNWICKVAQQKQSAHCRVYLQFYSTEGFLNRLPAGFTEIKLSAGQAVWIDWIDGLGPIGTTNWDNLSRAELFYQSILV